MGYPYRRDPREHLAPSCHVKFQRKMLIEYPERGSDPDTKSAGSLIVGLKPPELRKKKSLLFITYPVSGIFAKATQID